MGPPSRRSSSTGTSKLHDDEHIHAQADPKDIDVDVKVGWVKGLNRLYFLYQPYDNDWDFADPGLHTPQGRPRSRTRHYASKTGQGTGSYPAAQPTWQVHAAARGAYASAVYARLRC
jgi:hypothetical protein